MCVVSRRGVLARCRMTVDHAQVRLAHTKGPLRSSAGSAAAEGRDHRGQSPPSHVRAAAAQGPSRVSAAATGAAAAAAAGGRSGATPCTRPCGRCGGRSRCGMLAAAVGPPCVPARLRRHRRAVPRPLHLERAPGLLPGGPGHHRRGRPKSQLAVQQRDCRRGGRRRDPGELGRASLLPEDAPHHAGGGAANGTHAPSSSAPWSHYRVGTCAGSVDGFKCRARPTCAEGQYLADALNVTQQGRCATCADSTCGAGQYRTGSCGGTDRAACRCSGRTGTGGVGGTDCASLHEASKYCFTEPGACKDGRASGQLSDTEWSYSACARVPRTRRPTALPATRSPCAGPARRCSTLRPLRGVCA